MSFVHVASYRHRAVYAGGGTRQSPTFAGFLIQEGVILSYQSQIKKGA